MIWFSLLFFFDFSLNLELLHELGLKEILEWVTYATIYELPKIVTVATKFLMIDEQKIGIIKKTKWNDKKKHQTESNLIRFSVPRWTIVKKLHEKSHKKIFRR